MSSISKNIYIDILDHIVNKYNNAYHNTIKMKPVDVKSGKYINFNKENDKEDAKSEFGEHVRISEFKNIIAKSCVPNEDAL